MATKVSKGKRRAHGEGAIYQRGSDGRWCGVVDLGWAGGKRQRRTVYGATQAEVVAKMAELRGHVARGLPAPSSRLTVQAFLVDEWLPSLGKLKASTRDNYRNVVDLYIVPNIGRLPLAKLSPTDVQRMLERLEAEGRSPNTRRLARSVLRRALRYAELRGHVARNVASIVDGPRIGRPARRAMNPEQAAQLLVAAKGHPLETFVTVALSLGLRRGEALGLSWADVHLDPEDGGHGHLVIRQTLTVVAGRPTLNADDAKTQSSLRTVELPRACAEALRAHRSRQRQLQLAAGPAWNNAHDLVFTDDRGRWLDPNLVRRRFAKLAADAGIGQWSPHSLRHSAASLLLAQGVPLEVVSRILGHASIAITADVYGVIYRAGMREAASAMDTALGGAS